jgi:DNA-directed RNA polymerase specialized sigma24 family protein
VNLIDTLNTIPYPSLDDDARIDLLQCAKLGDQSALLTLTRVYLGPLVTETDRAVRASVGAGLAFDTSELREEVFSETLQVFYRVVDAFDTDRGMRGFVAFLNRALRNDEGVNSATNRARPMRIPYVSSVRRSQAIKAAGGDMEKARDLAPEYGITKSTFDAITRVFQSDVAIDDANATGLDRNFVRIEHLQDAERALGALDLGARMIVESSYGLNGQPQQSNHEIAANLGISRRSVQRRLEAAMLVMRETINDSKE